MASSKMTKTNAEENSTGLAPTDAIPNFDKTNWQDEQVGFAPYWKPVTGSFFIGRLVDRDDEAEDFVRYLVQAGQDVECQRGPADDAEKVVVKKGEHFTISVYFSLQGLFDFYLESGLTPWMKISAGEKVKTKTPGRQVFQWKVQLDPADKRKVDAARLKVIEAKKLAAADETPQLEENTGNAAE